MVFLAENFKIISVKKQSANFHDNFSGNKKILKHIEKANMKRQIVMILTIYRKNDHFQKPTTLPQKK